MKSFIVVRIKHSTRTIKFYIAKQVDIEGTCTPCYSVDTRLKPYDSIVDARMECKKLNDLTLEDGTTR